MKTYKSGPDVTTCGLAMSRMRTRHPEPTGLDSEYTDASLER